MSLMFARLARNYIKEGYFPTDEQSIEGILSGLSIEDREAEDGEVIRLFDPTCGEGTALADIRHRLAGARQGLRVISHGIEINSERFLHARSVLDDVLLADLNYCNLRSGGYSFMLCNPPYGQSLADRGDTGDGDNARRIEHNLTQMSVRMLAPEGVIALILPGYAFSRDLLAFLASRLRDANVYAAGVDTFKQVVLMGIRRERNMRPDLQMCEQLLEKVSHPQPFGEMPQGLYTLPMVTAPDDVDATSIHPFAAARIIDQRLLAETLAKNPAIGGGRLIDTHFEQVAGTAAMPPLMELGQWHAGLALAGGMVEGLVTSNDGKRHLLVKGYTVKVKEHSESFKTNEDGDVTATVVTQLDRFKTVIRGIDVTPDRPEFGSVIEIS